MSNTHNSAVNTGLRLVLQELEENPYRKFNFAFSLMSIIPFLVFVYILATRLFNFSIFIGDIGLTLLISIIISLCGFCVGYAIIKNILNMLIHYAAQAKHSDQLKSTFVATVSHELKNPLAIIKAGLDNLLSSLPVGTNEEQKKIIAICHDVIARMSRLINDLLDLHKIEAGMVEMKRGLCNFVELVERQIKEFEIILNEKGIKLIKEISDQDLSLWADEDKIMQVINNLLSNAIKYTPEGGLVTLKVYPHEEFVRLECVDTGPGIPADQINRLFNKFERLNIAKEGTGLGLAITKDIVEMHRGRIWAESKPGEGSRFIVILPCDLRQKKR